eukprot:TRINITY_DN5043_c0_g1_i2.p1 TRINITY_DN5043_c0_g1~~TRINITY_DN5043_c0_g1_i2.p1  ORF type:complete len:327 (+),score=56.70 TRINITY_DN5043_c0_g1_i2:147-1127(+)
MTLAMNAEEAETRVTSLMAGKRLQGSLKSYSDNNGYGFIECNETMDLFKADVYVARRQVEACRASVGATVSFNVVLTKDGKPQARNVSVETPGPQQASAVRPRDASGRPGGEQDGHANMNERRCVGTIKSFGQNTGFGFIDSPEVCGGDVFLHKSQIGRFQVGDQVCFTLQFEPERGRPRAKDLEAVPRRQQGAWGVDGSWCGEGGQDAAAAAAAWSSWYAMNPMGQYGMMGNMGYAMNPMAMAQYNMQQYGMGQQQPGMDYMGAMASQNGAGYDGQTQGATPDTSRQWGEAQPTQTRRRSSSSSSGSRGRRNRSRSRRRRRSPSV